MYHHPRHIQAATPPAATPPPRYQTAPQNLPIPLTWGSTALAHLPAATIISLLPKLANSLANPPARTTHIDIRRRLPDDYHSGDRYRNAAAAILNFLATPPSRETPLHTYLNKRLYDDYDDDGGLSAASSILHVSRAFGCQPSIQIPVEHFMLANAHALAAADEWQDVINELNPQGAVREQLECSRGTYNLHRQEGELMYAIEAAKVRPPPPPAVAAFESTLVPPDLKECWRNCKSIFVAASPDGLQGMLGGLVGGATLVPSSVGEKDGILDPANDVVMVEIRVLDRNPKEGSWEEKRLRSRVVEWLEDKQRREGWVKVYG